MLNGQNNVEVGAKRWKGEEVKRLLKVERWKSEKVKRWLTPIKCEKVKGWKGEKMAAPHRWTGRSNVAKKLERLVLLESLENLA